MIGFTDNNRNVRLQDVLVLANSITGATPNYYYSRRLPAAPNNVIEYMSGLYVRKGIQLVYYDDKGVGGQIPEGTISEKSDGVFRTKSFYTRTLKWDFDNIWTINEGEYPVFKLDAADRLTPIRTDKSSSSRSLGGIYDLQGRFLNSFTMPGLYVANGKKVSIK